MFSHFLFRPEKIPAGDSGFSRPFCDRAAERTGAEGFAPANEKRGSQILAATLSVNRARATRKEAQ
jgi:hypothetical protein